MAELSELSLTHRKPKNGQKAGSGRESHLHIRQEVRRPFTAGEWGWLSRTSLTSAQDFGKRSHRGSSGTKAGGGVGTVEHHGPDAADTLCSETVRK